MINRNYYLEIEKSIENTEGYCLLALNKLKLTFSTYTGNDIVIWGCGEYGLKCLKYLSKSQIHVSYFIDKDQTAIEQYKVYKPDKLKNLSKTVVLIIATLRYEEEIGHVIRNTLDTHHIVTISFCNLLAELVKEYIEQEMNKELLYEYENRDMSFLYGSFPDWYAALASVTELAYENPIILEKYIETWKRMKNGDLGKKPESKLLEAFLYAVCRENVLEVLDFGGALGNTYYYNRSVFGNYNLNWNVVEQKHIADWGGQHISELSFFSSIEKCMDTKKINVCLFSSSLQYLDKPYIYLEKCLFRQPQYIIFDRTPIKDIKKDIIMCQNVPEIIEGKRIAYPSWVFSQKKLEDFMKKNNYRKEMAWESNDCVWVKSCLGMIRYQGALYVLQGQTQTQEII